MTFTRRSCALAVVVGLLLASGTACVPPAGESDCGETGTCPDGQICGQFVTGELRCVAPLRIRGRVLRLVDDTPIADARVQAVDVNGAAVGTSGVTDADGTYTLTAPAVRDEDGRPTAITFTLRTQAAGFQGFPTPIRPALPIDASTAAQEESEWILESTLTTVKLIELPGDTSVLAAVSGTIDADPNAGIMVVAEGMGTALTGFSDSEGNYIVFNVPAGTYTVQGYAAGVQLVAATVTCTAGETKTGVDLVQDDRPLSTVAGNVQIVNASGDAVTSVVLAVESTFQEAAGRGDVPPGLRVGDVTGAFSIAGVPDGRYVVLAAFENDGLVRDPDQNIAGTATVRITVPDPDAGNTIDISDGFKITGALGVVSPGADGPEQITTTTPTLTWEDDSSEDGYEVQVFDAFGQEVWADEIGSVTGSATVSHVYAGPPLEPGMFYQFRTTSFRERDGNRTAISATEDLKGVFFLAGN